MQVPGCFTDGGDSDQGESVAGLDGLLRESFDVLLRAGCLSHLCETD